MATMQLAQAASGSHQRAFKGLRTSAGGAARPRPFNLLLAGRTPLRQPRVARYAAWWRGGIGQKLGHHYRLALLLMAVLLGPQQSRQTPAAQGGRRPRGRRGRRGAQDGGGADRASRPRGDCKAGGGWGCQFCWSALEVFPSCAARHHPGMLSRASGSPSDGGQAVEATACFIVPNKEEDKNVPPLYLFLVAPSLLWIALHGVQPALQPAGPAPAQVAACERAYAAGVRRQRVELLLPLIGATDIDDWPGGIRQQFKAAQPMVEQLLLALRQQPGVVVGSGCALCGWVDGGWEDSRRPHSAGLAAKILDKSTTIKFQAPTAPIVQAWRAGWPPRSWTRATQWAPGWASRLRPCSSPRRRRSMRCGPLWQMGNQTR